MGLLPFLPNSWSTRFIAVTPCCKNSSFFFLIARRTILGLDRHTYKWEVESEEMQMRMDRVSSMCLRLIKGTTWRP